MTVDRPGSRSAILPLRGSSTGRGHPRQTRTGTDCPVVIVPTRAGRPIRVNPSASDRSAARLGPSTPAPAPRFSAGTAFFCRHPVVSGAQPTSSSFRARSGRLLDGCCRTTAAGSPVARISASVDRPSNGDGRFPLSPLFASLPEDDDRCCFLTSAGTPSHRRRP